MFLQARKGNTYFTELAERVEYGSYDLGQDVLRVRRDEARVGGLSGGTACLTLGRTSAVTYNA